MIDLNDFNYKIDKLLEGKDLKYIDRRELREELKDLAKCYFWTILYFTLLGFTLMREGDTFWECVRSLGFCLAGGIGGMTIVAIIRLVSYRNERKTKKTKTHK